MLKLFLYPFSWLWGEVYRLRRFLYQYGVLKRSYFKVPILSVGNLSFGGTGKTPMIIWLLEQIEKLDKTGAVLTRGYKGELEKTSGVLEPQDLDLLDPNLCGDEPYLIASRMRKGGVLVGRKRSQNLQRHFDQLSPDIVLLDDGFQHLQLYRSFNLVLFDALLDLESYKTAPVGYLREGLSALRDADMIAISRADQVSTEKLNSLLTLLKKTYPSEKPIAKFSYSVLGAFSLSGEKLWSNVELKQKKLIAATGLASPESFYNSLESLGVELIHKEAFDDHHRFTEEDIKGLLSLAEENDASIIMSEKDIVKIKRLTQDKRIVFLKIAVDFISGEKELQDSIKKLLKLDSQ